MIPGFCSSLSSTAALLKQMRRISTSWSYFTFMIVPSILIFCSSAKDTVWRRKRFQNAFHQGSWNLSAFQLFQNMFRETKAQWAIPLFFADRDASTVAFWVVL